MSAEAPNFGAPESSPQGPTQGQEQGLEQTPNEYDALFSGEGEEPEGQTPAEAAAVRPEALPPVTSQQTSEQVDAQLREYTPQPPLSAAEIAAKRGGQWPTQEQVDGINAARAAGKHLS